MLPFKFQSWDSQDILYITYYNIVFNEDFGSFKRDEPFSSIDVDYQKGHMIAFDINGKEFKRENFSLKTND